MVSLLQKPISESLDIDTAFSAKKNNNVLVALREQW